MLRPKPEIYVASTIAGGVLGYSAGGAFQTAGGLWLLLFTLATFLATCYYTVFVWNLPKNHPLGLVFGFSGLGLLLATIAAWIGWTNDTTPPILADNLGRLVGLVGFLVATPGFVRRRYRGYVRWSQRVPVLIGALSDAEPEVQCRAARRLAQIGMPDAEPAVPALLLATDDKHSGTSLSAYGALLMLGVPADNTVDRLRGALQNGVASLSDLREFGPALEPLLIGCLADDHFQVRASAAELLGKTAANSSAAAAALAKALEDSTSQVRLAAARAIGMLRTDSDVADDALRRAKSDSVRKVRRAAGKSLSRRARPLPAVRFGTRKLLPWALVASVIVLAGYGCSYTPIGRLNYICVLRDFGGSRTAPLLVEALADSSMDVQSAARKGLERLGPDAVPALLDGLTHPNYRVHNEVQGLLDAVREQSVVALTDGLNHRDREVRLEVMRQLEQLGPQAAPAVAALSILLKDDDREVRIQAAKTLASIGAPAAPAVAALSDALGDDDGEVRQAVAGAISSIGPPAKSAVGSLIELLDTDPVPAADALAAIGPDAAPATAVLRRTLSHADADVRRAAARAIGAIASSDTSVVTALLRLQNDSEEGVRQAAGQALDHVSPQHARILRALGDGQNAATIAANFQPSGETPVSVLIDILQHGRPQQRRDAVRVLEPLGPAANSATASCIALLQDANEDKAVRATAATAIGFVARDEQGLAALRQALAGDASAEVRIAIVKALRQFGDAAIPALMEALSDRSSQVWTLASNELADVGSAAVPELRSAVTAESSSLAARASVALAKIGPAAEAALPALRDRLNDRYAYARLYAAAAVWKIGRDEQAIAVLGSFLTNKDSYFRQYAAELLGEAGPAAKPAVADLATATVDDDKTVRLAALRALTSVGPDASAAVPKLCDVLRREQSPDDERDETRLAAIAALGSIGPAAVEAVPVLVDLVKTHEPILVGPAAAALGQIGPPARESVAALLEVLQFGFFPAETERRSRGLSIYREEYGPSEAEIAERIARDAAIEALGAIGSDAREAVPALIERVLRSAPQFQESPAWKALVAIDPQHSETVRDLTARLSPPEGSVDKTVYPVIGALGAAAQDMVPVLVKSLTDQESERVYYEDEIIAALGQLGPVAAEAVPALLQIAKRPDDWHADDAAEALARIAPNDPQVFTALVNLTEATSDDLRTTAVEALGEMSPEAGDPVAALTTLLTTSGDASVISACIRTLGKLGPRAKEAVSVLTSLLQNKDATTRCGVAVTLWRIDGQVKPGLPAVVAAMEDEFDPERLADQIAVLGVDAVAVLRDSLQTSDSPKVRRGVIAALGRIGPPAAPAVDELSKALADEDSSVRRLAAAALGQIGPAAKAATEALLTAFDQWRGEESGYAFSYRNPGVDAAEALARIDPAVAAKVALDLLVTEAQRSPHSANPAQAIEVLGLIGPLASNAIPKLREIQSQANAELQQIRWNQRMRSQYDSDRGTQQFEYDLQRVADAATQALQKIETSEKNAP